MREPQSVTRNYDTLPGVGIETDTALDAADFDARPNADAALDSGPDTSQSDARSGDATVPPTSELACDRAARVAACEAPLLEPASAPTNARDPLFYVNRAFAIPASFPVSAISTWTPCQAGTPPAGADYDLVCLPDPYTTQSVSLRAPAWESDAPTAPVATHDGKAVGHLGKVGFKAAFDAALEEAGAELFAASCFRSYARQASLFESYVADEMAEGLSEDEATIVASTYSARPGHSEHQLGTTCDLVYRRDDGSISSFGRASARTMYESVPFRWLAANAHRFGLVVTYAHDRVAVTQYVWEPWHWRFVGVEAADTIKRCSLSTEELLNARYQAGPLPVYEGEHLILYARMQLLAETGAGTLPVDPGQPFTRTWTVENSGTLDWWHAVFAHVEGEDFGAADADVACTPPLARTTLALGLGAPGATGTYAGIWRLLDDRGAELVPDDFVVRAFVRGDAIAADPYRYVRIDDLSGASGGADPGADVDGMVLRRAGGGAPVYAVDVTYYAATPGAVTRDDPDEALGVPDAFSDYPDTDTCEVGGGFVALGGGGTLIVDLGVGLEAGDTLEVLEVGACDYGGGTAIADAYAVRASVGAEVGGAWEPVGNSDGGPDRFTVPFLPPRQR